MNHFRAEQRKSLQRQLRDCPPSDSQLKEFLERYYFFESLIRVIGSYYRRRGGKKTSSEAHSSLQKNVVSRSFNHFGIRVSDGTLDLLISSDRTRRGEKSARNLRNGIVHNWSKEDRQEVLERIDPLQSALQKAITAIQEAVDRS